MNTSGPIDAIAGEPIFRGAAITWRNNEIWLADAATDKAATGIALQSATAGQMTRCVHLSGLAEVYTGLLTGKWYYLGNTGALVDAKPSAGMVQGIGIALTTNALAVQVSAP